MKQSNLNKKRREAVQLRLDGQKIAEISNRTGLSAPTIITAHKMFKEGGWNAVDAQPRGRTRGQNQRLSDDQQLALRDLIFSAPVSNNVSTSGSGTQPHTGPHNSLWTLASVEQYLQESLKIKLSARTLARYLSEFGLQTENQLKLARSSDKFAPWFEQVYPTIVTSSTDSTILWTACTRIDKQDSTLIYTHTLRGKCCWLAGDYDDAVEHLKEFSARAIQLTGGPVSLIVGGIDIFSRTSIRQQFNNLTDVSLYPHPSLDLNPPLPLLTPKPAPQVGTNQTANQHPSTQSVTESATPSVKQPATPSVKQSATQSVSNAATTTAQSLPSAKSPATADVADAPTVQQPESTSTNEPRHQKRTNRINSTMSLTHLERLEAESIHIMREVIAEADKPVMLYSIGKDSAVMLHLAMKAFYPAKPPFPLLHVDTGWKFKAMYQFRDKLIKDLDLELLTHTNPEGLAQGVNPFTHGSALHTDIMKTEALRQALDKHGFDVAFGGARRDEEKSRAKERIFSFRTEQHRWDPKNQRPELWNLYNARKHKGESIRVFPLSNWTELDIWQYIHLENIPIVPLYLSAERPVVMRDGTLIMVDDDRMPMNPGEVPMMRRVRFRTLGCYPLTGAVESDATTLPEIIQEMLLANTSERQGRMIDHDSSASMEKKKQEGYF